MSEKGKSRRRNANTAIILALISAAATIAAALITTRSSELPAIHPVVVRDVVRHAGPVEAPSAVGHEVDELHGEKTHITFVTNDAALEQYLGGIARAIESHRWELLLSYFGEENYLEQRNVVFEGNLPIPQYLEEGLGLGFVDNDLPVLVSEFPFARLNTIRSVEFTSLERVTDSDDDRIFHFLEIRGRVALNDDTERDIMLLVRRKVTGGFEVSPPLG